MKIRSLIVIVLIAMVSLFVMTACGEKKDEKKEETIIGTWEGRATSSSGEGILTIFSFESDGTAKYENEYGFKSVGTYELKDNRVTITVELWSSPKEYTYEIKDGKLYLTANDNISPSYEAMNRK